MHTCPVLNHAYNLPNPIVQPLWKLYVYVIRIGTRDVQARVSMRRGYIMTGYKNGTRVERVVCPLKTLQIEW